MEMGKETVNQSSENETLDFHEAAILNEDGSETPITEDMIQDACKRLNQASPDTKESDSSPA
ncbi:MAG: hypothetical protein DRR06_02645 [Gammaproteobacteria bacterium]|nr:MAG: hypothetical protein DRR06_02645 [Gammaproteobacteria bacterium]RLA53375.1 MAG: hypothetical protein DRR42_04985 [Gammaproteobacteria bacterium]